MSDVDAAGKTEAQRVKDLYRELCTAVAGNDEKIIAHHVGVLWETIRKERAKQPDSRPPNKPLYLCDPETGRVSEVPGRATWRREIASRCLAGMLACPEAVGNYMADDWLVQLPKRAVEYADALLAELDKEK